MSIKTTTVADGNVVIMEPKGSFIGGPETDELKNMINGFIEQTKLRLIIDLADVTYLNSSAIGILTVAHTSYLSRGGKMILCNVNKSITNVFVVTKLATVLFTEESRQDAILAIGK